MARKKQPKEVSQSLYATPGTLLFYVDPYNAWRKMRAQSPHTITRDTHNLLRFIRFCEERAVHAPGDVTRAFLERYQRHLSREVKSDGKPLSIRAQLGYVLSVRGFFRYLCRERVLVYNPASELLLPRIGKRLPRHILTSEEAERVLCTPDLCDPLGLRDRAILETLYLTGIRRAELCFLRQIDVDLEGLTLFVHQGKGRKDRMIPLGQRAALWIKKYLADGRPHLIDLRKGDEEGYVFLSNAGEHIAPNYLTEIVQKYVLKSGIGKPGSCHLFRHTMATLMLEGGADVRYVQAMLGHSQLSTTEIYTHVSIGKLKEVHAKAHPAKAYRTVILPHEEVP
jgi:integrase/recombinase XerD